MRQANTNNRHALLFLIYPVLILWFKYLEITIQPKYFTDCWIDQYVPFIPAFVVPYALWFVLIAASMIYYCLYSRSDFLKLCAFLYIGMAISLTLFMIFPNGQNLRPELGSGVFMSMVDFLYQIDTPTNSAPSIHIINAIAVHAAVMNSRCFVNRRWLRRTSACLAVLISLSTVLTKQHAIIDTVFGLFIALTLYVGVYKIQWSKLRKRTPFHREETNSSILVYEEE